MKPERIVFATGNKDKMREIRMILSDLDLPILSMKEAGVSADIVEDGKTFLENALIKARAISRLLPNDVIMADDSGLEIDYLNKEPGIYSARYMGEHTSYDIKNNALLQRLENVPAEKRTARFVCAIAAVFPDQGAVILISVDDLQTLVFPLVKKVIDRLQLVVDPEKVQLSWQNDIGSISGAAHVGSLPADIGAGSDRSVSVVGEKIEVTLRRVRPLIVAGSPQFFFTGWVCAVGEKKRWGEHV